MNKKKLIPVVALSTIALVGTIGMGTVSASSPAGNTIAKRIATRFNLNENDVQAVLEEVRNEQHEIRLLEMENLLTQAVEDGVLTEEQRDELIAIRTSFHNSREEMAEMTQEERRAAMDAHRDMMKAWAEENDIDLRELGPAFGNGPRHGHKGFGEMNAE